MASPWRTALTDSGILDLLACFGARHFVTEKRLPELAGDALRARVERDFQRV